MTEVVVATVLLEL